MNLLHWKICPYIELLGIIAAIVDINVLKEEMEPNVVEFKIIENQKMNAKKRKNQSLL